MSLDGFAAGVLARLTDIPQDQRLIYIKEQLSGISDSIERQTAENLIGIGLCCGVQITEEEQVVVLIHGIRTQAPWQDMVAEELRRIPNVTVYPIGYGFFDAFRFWFPFFFRRFPLNRVLREVRGIRAKHPGANISVVAHSFGTYIMARILRDNPDIVLYRLLLCGSVIPTDFRWDMVPALPKEGVLNDVGTKDCWPVLAKAMSWGYGCSGTFGFKTYSVTDRYHDYGHSDFFQAPFIQQYWVPYIAAGTIVSSPWSAKRQTPNWFLSTLSVAPLKLIIGITLAVVAWNIF